MWLKIFSSGTLMWM